MVNTNANNKARQQNAALGAQRGGEQRKKQATAASPPAAAQVRAVAQGVTHHRLFAVGRSPAGPCRAHACPGCALRDVARQGVAPGPGASRGYKEQSCGALNLRNTCFLNATLQALLAVYYNTASVRPTPADSFLLAKQAVQQMERLVHGVSPSREQCEALLCELPYNFGWHYDENARVVSVMEDASECFVKLLDALRFADPGSCSCLTFSAKHTCKCASCKRVSRRSADANPVWSLGLPPRGASTSVQQLVDAYLAPEIVDAYTCTICGIKAAEVLPEPILRLNVSPSPPPPRGVFGSSFSPASPAAPQIAPPRPRVPCPTAQVRGRSPRSPAAPARRDGRRSVNARETDSPARRAGARSPKSAL
jgi:hypothetical protein